MSELSCAEARELAPEVAIGVADAEDRARLLGHVATCTDCSAFLADLSAVVDNLVGLTAGLEPPAGFESDVLTRLADRRVISPLKRRRRFWMQVAAAIVALAIVGAGSGLAVYRAHDADRKLASQIRGTLATAHGQYFTAAPLLAPDGARRGVVFGYQGEPTWTFLIVTAPASFDRATVELVLHDGSRRTIGQDVALTPDRGWGSVIPVAVHDVAVIRVVDASGELVLSARLAP